MWVESLERDMLRHPWYSSNIGLVFPAMPIPVQDQGNEMGVVSIASLGWKWQCGDCKKHIDRANVGLSSSITAFALQQENVTGFYSAVCCEEAKRKATFFNSNADKAVILGIALWRPGGWQYAWISGVFFFYLEGFISPRKVFVNKTKQHSNILTAKGISHSWPTSISWDQNVKWGHSLGLHFIKSITTTIELIADYSRKRRA